MATARCNVQLGVAGAPEVLKRLPEIFANVQGFSFDDILSFQTLQHVQTCVERHVFLFGYWILEENEHISMFILLLHCELLWFVLL